VPLPLIAGRTGWCVKNDLAVRLARPVGRQPHLTRVRASLTKGNYRPIL
jgi:hypothetical protein